MSFSNEDILTLAKAGFNAQQIAALSAVGAAPTPAPAPQPTPTPAPQPTPTPAPAPQPTPTPAPAPQPTPTPAPQPTPTPAPATVDDVLKSVKDLTQTMQNGFILGSQQPKQPTAEEILANIINPPLPKKEV